MIHGLGSDRRCFNAAVSAPDLASVSLLIPDLPGFGESKVEDPDFGYRLEEFVDGLIQLFGHHRIKSCAVIGHSMGGATAILLAEKFPVTHLVNAVGNLVSDDTLFSRRVSEQSLEDFTVRGFQSFKRAARIGARVDRPLSSYFAALEKTTARAMHATSRDLVHHSDHGDLLERFVRLSCRKLYLQDSDNGLAPGVAERLEAAGIQREIIPNTGHGLMEDNPMDFYRAVGRFLNS